MTTRHKSGEEGQLVELDVHPCTDDDFKMFFPVQKKAEYRLSLLRKRKDRQLYCLDFGSKDVSLIGELESGDYNILEILLVPCNMNLTAALGFEDARIGGDCIPSYNEQMLFMAMPNLVIYHNQ